VTTGQYVIAIAQLIFSGVLGGAMVWIGIQQHKTNKDNAARQLKVDRDRLKMELFDRRYKVYKKLGDFMDLRFEHVDMDKLMALQGQFSPAVFLFANDDTIYKFLVKVVEAGREVCRFKHEHGWREGLTIFDLEEPLQGEAKKLWGTLIIELRSEGLGVFNKFLSLKF
jgi:hypothetical protein